MSRKRAAPEDSSEVFAAKHKVDAEWKYKKNNWAKVGEPEYEKIKKKMEKGTTLDSMRYLPAGK
jgi:hypothetical protein